MKTFGCVVTGLRDRVCLLAGALVVGASFGATAAVAQLTATLPEAPSLQVGEAAERASAEPTLHLWAPFSEEQASTSQGGASQGATPAQTDRGDHGPVGADGKQIRPQPTRVFGILPNFIAISGGTKPKPAGWKTDLSIANRQNYDYSSFGFLLISTSLAYAQDSHPSLDTVNGGDAVFWAYLWRGFLDKTDGSYQGTFFFPALLHEDTRYYALGTGSAKRRLAHAALSVVVAHNYEQKPIFNLAGQLGRVGAQAVSTTYYPAGSESFGVLAKKFAYVNMRAVIYAVVREFSPEAQAYVYERHSRKAEKQAAADQAGAK